MMKMMKIKKLMMIMTTFLLLSTWEGTLLLTCILGVSTLLSLPPLVSLTN